MPKPTAVNPRREKRVFGYNLTFGDICAYAGKHGVDTNMHFELNEVIDLMNADIKADGDYAFVQIARFSVDQTVAHAFVDTNFCSMYDEGQIKEVGRRERGAKLKKFLGSTEDPTWVRW